MKLAEALQERSDLNKKIADLNNRLSLNCLVQEGELPNENPDDLLKTLEQCLTRLQKLITDINLTNCKTIIEGRTITEIIAEKDCAALRLTSVREGPRLNCCQPSMWVESKNKQMTLLNKSVY